MVFLTGCGIAKKTYHTNNDKTNITKITKEKEVTPYQDAFTDLKNVKKDLKDLVDIIHGDAHIEKRTGHAYGDYTKDISSYVIGWILGIESDQDLVEGTGYAHPKKNLITDRSLTYPQTGKKVPVQKEETGHLRYGKVDVENEVGDVLTDFYYKLKLRTRKNLIRP